MELENLKAAWQKQNEKLSKNLTLNEEILRRINLSNSKREMQSPLFYDLFSVAILALWTLWMGKYTLMHIDQYQYSLPALFNIGVALCYLIFSLIRIKKLQAIRYYTASVVEVQTKLIRYNKTVLKQRVYELSLIPLFIVGCLPILYWEIRNIDIYDHLGFFSIVVLITLLVAYPLSLWIARQLVDKKLAIATQLLEEVESFSKD